MESIFPRQEKTVEFVEYKGVISSIGVEKGPMGCEFCLYSDGTTRGY